MRKPLRIAAAFLLSAVLGTLLLILLASAIGYAAIAVDRHNYPGSGLGAVAGGLSEAAVLLVPILCGVIGTLITLRCIERKQASSHHVFPTPPPKWDT